MRYNPVNNKKCPTIPSSTKTRIKTWPWPLIGHSQCHHTIIHQNKD